MLPVAPAAPEGGDVFRDGGENGRLMAAFDWSATPVGPVSGWPASLRFAVRTVLVSRFPMILTWGPEYTQFYNDAYAELIGAKHPGAIGDDLRITLAEGWAALQGPVEHAMAAREASWLPQLLLLLERAGYREETYFTVSHAPAFGDDGEVAGMHAVCTEVTRQVIAERRQRLLHEVGTSAAALGDERATAEAMCRALGTGALDVPFAAVYLADPHDGRLLRVATVGDGATLLPGVAATPAEVLPADVARLGAHGGPFGDPVTEAVALPLAVTGGEPVGVLVAGVSPNRALDADYRSFHELLAGQFTGAVVNARAYETERRRAESLAELDAAKTTFFANVSHELRTPLTLLLGPIGDLLREPASSLPPVVHDSLTLAMRNGQRLRRLVDDLLEFVSIEAGRTSAVRVETDVAGLTAELAGVLRAAAERAGLRLTVDCPPLPRPAYVDPRMWEKIVFNLVGNAIKYTFVGGVDVTLRAEGEQLVLMISDTGVGIPAEELPRLFERFHRVPGAVSRSREGTGLGLALVRELVSLHGGTVAVESRPGAGSTFAVTLPFGEPDHHGERSGRDGTSGVPLGATLTPWDDDLTEHELPAVAESSAGSVLVVDDNADMRAYLTRLLRPHWTVRTAANGEEALRSIAEQRPDAVVSDVMMPVMDGFSLLRALRGDPATEHLPVLLLTARAGQEAAAEGLTAGADDYLAKPFQAPELVARVRIAVQRAAGGAPPRQRPDRPSGGEAAAVPTRRPPPAAPARTPGAVHPVEPGPRREHRQRTEHEPDPGPSRRSAGPHGARWRYPSAAASVPPLRRRLRRLLDEAGLDPDTAYDLVLAACEAATNAIEHAQQPTESFFDVSAEVVDDRVEIRVRDYGRWRERVPSMDRGRGSTLMSAVAEVTATPSPGGTTVAIRTRLRPGTAAPGR